MSFLGDTVKDQNSNFAIFDNLSSAPPGMEAAKSVDAYSLLEGNEGTCADAESA